VRTNSFTLSPHTLRTAHKFNPGWNSEGLTRPVVGLELAPERGNGGFKRWGQGSCPENG
jgi:hypothetical protein